MNWLWRLFKKKIEEKELKELILALGKNKGYLNQLYGSQDEYSRTFTRVNGYLDIKPQGKDFIFDLDISPNYVHRAMHESEENRWMGGSMLNIKKTISYEELNKNPVLKQYVKGKSLEKSLAVLSVASILASAFFISNNITGNAILTNNANSSGIIGAGLFVFGVGSWILARNI